MLNSPNYGKKTIIYYSQSKINQQAATAYENFRAKTKLITSGSQLKEIKEIGKKMEIAVSTFYNKEGEDPTRNFDWDYILVDNDKVVNAWCMPGGKIAVYTGLLKVTKNTDALSIVMGHEIAHAVAKHSVERASQQMALGIADALGNIITRCAISNARNQVGQATGMDIYRIGIMNPFGRKQESDADYLGLIFSSLSGYDIRRVCEAMEKNGRKK